MKIPVEYSVNIYSTSQIAYLLSALCLLRLLICLYLLFFALLADGGHR